MSKETENKANRLKEKFETSQMVGQSQGSIGPLSIQIQNAFIIAVTRPETSQVCPPPPVLIYSICMFSLIMGHVYSLEDQLPTEMAGV